MIALSNRFLRYPIKQDNEYYEIIDVYGVLVGIVWLFSRPQMWAHTLSPNNFSSHEDALKDLMQILESQGHKFIHDNLIPLL